MDALIASEMTLGRPRRRQATAARLAHAERGRSRIAAIALAAAVLTGLVLGLVDGAAGRPLGDPGPVTGPLPGLAEAVPLASPN